ncbi:MAG TPA: ribosome biogenesis GTPase Der [Firmicutes bacterium]|nr:ribosome biogenesis GTPase Der [Bacillota bacterium]
MAKSRPIVAIVGRPNVGKSTLFNRIIQKRLAVVEETPGVTRDRIYSAASWRGREFLLVDTGGIDPYADPDQGIPGKTRQQAEIAIAESDVVLFVVDGRDGITDLDRDIANILRKTQKPIILAVNKLENRAGRGDLEFYELGLGDPLPISALHGTGTGDLLDEVVKHLPEETPAGPPADADTGPKIAVVGRPNVGKSSLVNAILGEPRTIVTDIPGTTVDSIDTEFRRDGRPFVIIDTAGIRRKARVESPVERYSVMRAVRAIERADVAVLVLDATTGPTEQDAKIGGLIHEAGRGCVIAVNKWDLAKSLGINALEFEKATRARMLFLDYAPVIFISARTGRNIGALLETVEAIAHVVKKEIPTSQLNSLIEDVTARVPPPTRKGKVLKLYYATQVGTRPPTFILFVNNPELMHFSYLRYLENEIRKAFGFQGTRVLLLARPRS